MHSPGVYRRTTVISSWNMRLQETIANRSSPLNCTEKKDREENSKGRREEVIIREARAK